MRVFLCFPLPPLSAMLELESYYTAAENKCPGRKHTKEIFLHLFVLSVVNRESDEGETAGGAGVVEVR